MTAPNLPPEHLRPAAHLLGQTLQGGWRVTEAIPKGKDDTGGYFSCSYLVERNGTTAFLKALDLSEAHQSQNPASTLQQMTTAYEFERNLVMACGHMDRVVQAIDSGDFRFPNGVISVPFLVFERAESGDVRKFVRTAQSFDQAWSVRSLHHIAVGLSQLHSEEIAHQDLKPSNVMVFGEDGERGSKVGDFGRASRAGITGPTDFEPIPGDMGYAAPEQLYRHRPTDWRELRLAPDLYHLGSMAVYLFLGQSMTSLLESRLASAHHWRLWGGTYGQVVPYLRQSLDEVLIEFDAEVPPALRKGGGESELTLIVRYLCDPEPLLRGHPRNRGAGNAFGLQRFISRFDYMAQLLELRIGRMT